MNAILAYRVQIYIFLYKKLALAISVEQIFLFLLYLKSFICWHVSFPIL